jgi:hypothetical protein
MHVVPCYQETQEMRPDSTDEPEWRLVDLDNQLGHFYRKSY